MQYPLSSEYVQSIRDPQDNLDRLSHLVPVLDARGEPLRSSGAFAVVFKMEDPNTKKQYALKCFSQEQQGRASSYAMIGEELKNTNSPYIISFEYYDKELYVNTICTPTTEFPILLMDWVEGETMDVYISSHYHIPGDMKMLTFRFCELAAWLHRQPFAHGDIKPDNIIVRPDGTLVLIDYDSMYVPLMQGSKSPTLGSKDYAHPLRTIDDFNETIDDFSLASIALSLKAISIEPELYCLYGTSDGMIISSLDYLDLSNSEVFKTLHRYIVDKEFCQLIGNFLIAYAQKDLSLHSFRNFQISQPL